MVIALASGTLTEVEVGSGSEQGWPEPSSPYAPAFITSQSPVGGYRPLAERPTRRFRQPLGQDHQILAEPWPPTIGQKLNSLSIPTTLRSAVLA
jgi:hypothetical protein